MPGRAHRSFVFAGLFAAFLLILVRPAAAQEFSGLVYLDYDYTLQSADGESDGENGFGYRRLYLTGDYDISERFSFRARLEANDGSTTAQGRPAPFVKDAYLKWRDVFGAGHDLEMGITSPPSFKLSEKVWGYRSLAKTTQDFFGVVSSRDMGVLLKGPITKDGSVRYGVMVGNNSGVSRESNKQKRVYSQVEFYPNDRVIATVGGDYAALSGPLDQAVNLNAFVGTMTDGFAGGVEAFYNMRGADDPAADRDAFAVSLFARKPFNDGKNEVVARFDRFEQDLAGVTASTSLFIAGVSFRPARAVRFIPNVVVVKAEGADPADITGRITVHADF